VDDQVVDVSLLNTGVLESRHKVILDFGAPRIKRSPDPRGTYRELDSNTPKIFVILVHNVVVIGEQTCANVYSAIARIAGGGIEESPDPGFDLVAQMDIGTGLLTNNYNIMNKDYKDFGRVAIKLSIGSSWVWASFDSWSPKIQDYFMPTLENARVQQRYINNLVIHKSPSAEVMTGSSAKGNVEMWANNYGKRNAKKIPGAHDGLFDFGDHRAGGGSHGCFQVHDYLNKQTVLAVNELRKKGRHAVGIGNRKIGPNKKLVYPDWTYAANIATYTKRNEAVRVTWFFQPKNYGKPKTSDKKL
jgi:hypothetical protein